MTDTNKTQKPGAAALENMKLLKTESALFKVPVVPVVSKKSDKKKSLVLDEDVYVEGIAKIIQRDFFPDLEKLKAQNEFLEATENKDYARLQEITRKYSGHKPTTEPYNTPATFDTPEIGRPFTPLPQGSQTHQTDKTQEKSKLQDITEKHSLDSYLATHTSEDNASYDRVIAMEQKKRAGKLAQQFDAEISSKALAESAVILPSIEEQADQTNRPIELATWKFRARNYIMYVPDGDSSQPKSAKPELIHHNTRLSTDPFDQRKNKETISAIAKTQDATVIGKIGVDGTTSTEKDITNYSYVATPSPRPGGGADQSPMMTWGEIEGTPFRLDGGDTPLPALGAGAAYRMLECGARDRIGLQLAEQAAKKRRPTTPRLTPATPSFRSNTDRLASMSPAARKLAAKHLLSPRLRLTPSNMGILSTASPKRPRTQKTPLVATPNRSKNVTNSISSDDTLTDNLLQINVAKRARLKAHDFFK